MTQPQQPITSSISKGINFHFQDGDNQIRANLFGFIFSRKEIIYFNEEEVSNYRSKGINSIHKFTINNAKYEIECSLINIISGQINCTLIKDCLHIKTLELNPLDNLKSTLKSSFYWLLLFLLFGAAIGYTLAKT